MGRKITLKQILLPFIILILIFFISSLWGYYSKRSEYQKQIYFEVDSVKITKALRAYLYDKKGKEFFLTGITFYDFSEIKSGDIIIKEAYSDSIKAYRKDSIGNLKVIYKARQSETMFDFLDNIFPLPEKDSESK